VGDYLLAQPATELSVFYDAAQICPRGFSFSRQQRSASNQWFAPNGEGEKGALSRQSHRGISLMQDSCRCSLGVRRPEILAAHVL
jgi:hypothetical protein